jgi:hypothetical protein
LEDVVIDPQKVRAFAEKYGITIHFFEHQGHSLESVADKVVDLAIKFFCKRQVLFPKRHFIFLKCGKLFS